MLMLTFRQTKPAIRRHARLATLGGDHKVEEQEPNRAELVTQMFSSVLTEASGTLKLYFTLSTGAVVVFVNLLATSHAPRLVLVPLSLSILAFGLAAVFCLHVLSGLMHFRLLITGAVITRPPLSDFKTQIDAWTGTVRKQAKRMERLFWAGMAFAAIFVTTLVAVR